MAAARPRIAIEKSVLHGICIRSQIQIVIHIEQMVVEMCLRDSVAASPETAPWLCLVEGRRGGKTGITVKNNLFIYKSKDVLSDEMTRILGKYREDM